MNDVRLFRLLLSICRIAAVVTVVLTALGVWRNQTGVPWWDMWDGYVNFYLHAASGAAWWEQHNEHRLLLPRLFFYADLRWFGGLSWLPLAGSLAAAGGMWALLAHLWRRIRPDDLDRNAAQMVFWALGVACFSWAQSDNFTVAFQIQFFLACLLPLGAFVCLAAYAAERTRHAYFAAAALLGALSAGTMANGIAVPLLVCVYAVFLRLRPAQLVLLAVLAIGVPALYLHGYVAPAIHDTPLHAWTQTPGRALWFSSIFLGSALTQLHLGMVIAGLVGLTLVGLLIGFGTRRLLEARNAPWAAVPAIFLGYAVLTALATASGRTSMGLGAALAGRYATVSLLALAVGWLLVLAQTRRPWLRRAALIIGSFCCVGNLAVQAQALESVAWHNNGLRLGQLALSLGVNDAPALETLYPDNARLRRIAEQAREYQLGLFGVWPYRDVRAQIGQPAAQVAQTPCAVVIERSARLPGQEALRIEGHLADAKAAPYQGFVWLIDADDRIAGLALAGMQRPSGQGTEEIVDNGFIGYATSGQPVRRAVCAARP